MKIKYLISALALATLISGCTTKQVVSSSHNVDTKIEKNKPDLNNVTVEKNIEPENKIVLPIYELSKNEKEFLDILSEDKYASICGNYDRYFSIKQMPDSLEKSKELKEFFYIYANNLNNSCINQKAFTKTLKKRSFKENHQYYEMYNVKLDKTALLSKFESNQNVKSILSKYTPKHPNFFKFINNLDNSKLTKTQYDKLRLNIERLKLLKNYKENNFIQLNVPSYNFTLYEKGKVERAFGTVVGAKDSQTPIFSSKLSYFIVNPAWNIPDSIAKATIIPKALKDRNYLRKKNIVIRKKSYKLDAPKVRFKDVKWKKYLKKHVKYIPYKFIQLPSSTNGMGRVKFMFPNNYAVYMHDTIGTWRFKVNKEKIRSVSHGCVRLEHPISFMKHVTTYYTPKSYKSIRKSYLTSEMRTVGLSKKLPVHITYLTAYVKNGKIGFYKDIYGYDRIQKLNFDTFESFAMLSKKDKIQ